MGSNLGCELPMWGWHVLPVLAGGGLLKTKLSVGMNMSANGCYICNEMVLFFVNVDYSVPFHHLPFK